MANVLTCCRILLSGVLIFFPAFSPVFYACYLAAGFSDMIDGTVARKLGTESALGAKLDTAADIVFFSASAVKILPAAAIPSGVWIWAGIVALIKLVNIISGFVLYKKFVSVHTAANKVTGFLLFLLPLTMSAISIKYTAIVVCAVACFAAVQEGHFIRTGKTVQ